jgi:hypothetical protein
MSDRLASRALARFRVQVGIRDRDGTVIQELESATFANGNGAIRKHESGWDRDFVGQPELNCVGGHKVPEKPMDETVHTDSSEASQ